MVPSSGLPFDSGPRPNVETSRDALDRERIPEQYRDTGLDEPLPLRWQGWQWRWWHFTWPLIVTLLVLRVAVPLVASVRWGEVLGGVTGALRTVVIAILLVASPWLVKRAIALWRDTKQSLTSVVPWWLVLGVAFFLIPTPLWAFVALALALAFIARVATEVITHTVSWLKAKARVVDASENSLLELWAQPNLRGSMRETVAQLRAPSPSPTGLPPTELVERRNYNRGFLLIAIGFGASFSILAFSSSLVRGGLLAVLALFLVLAVYGWLNIDEYRRAHGLTWSDVRAALQSARDSWVNYNWDEEKRVGMWESPVATSLPRCDRLIYAYRFFAVGLLLTASYFPLVPLVVGDTYLDRAQVAHATTMADWSTKRLEQDLGTAVSRGLQQRGVRPTLERTSEVLTDARQSVREAARELWTIPHRSSPEGWLKLSTLSIYYDGASWTYAVLALAVAFFASLFLPGFFFEVTLVALLGRAIVHHTRRWEEVREATDKVGMSEWNELQAKVGRHGAAVKQDHVLVGRRVETGEPRWVHRETIHHHVHVAGSTGSGKTSRLLTPLVNQLTDGESSVVVFDLKGDPALFEEARLSAERANLSFRWFTTEPNRSTFAFNPLNQSHLRSFPGLSLATIYTSALGLEYGPGYGKSHFSEQHLRLLARLLVEAETDIRSFRDLDAEVRRRIDAESERRGRRTKKPSERLFRTPKQQEHAMDLESKVWKLSLLEALNIRPGDPTGPREQTDAIQRYAIDMADVVRFPQVLYFHLPSSLSSTIDREVGRLALFSLLTASQVANDAERRQMYVVIDEFQELVSTDLRKFFDQARNKRIAVVAANQSDAQLDSVDRNLRRAIADNVSLRIDFTANDIQSRRELVEASGEAFFTLDSYSTNSSTTDGPNGTSFTQGESHTVHQQIGPRFRPNDIAAMSAEEGLCQVWEKQNRGHGQFRGLPDHVEAFFHITKDEFAERSRASWPRDFEHPGAFTPDVSSTPAAPVELESPVQPDLPLEPPKPSRKKGSIARKLDKIEPPDQPDS